MERRIHPRYHARFVAFCSSGREEGEGRLRDLSYSGAQLADVALRPGIGTKVRLMVLIEPTPPFELSGTVVRELDDGFAIEFNELAPEVRNLVDDVAAIVRATD
jgi:hypothetical protein